MTNKVDDEKYKTHFNSSTNVIIFKLHYVLLFVNSDKFHKKSKICENRQCFFTHSEYFFVNFMKKSLLFFFKSISLLYFLITMMIGAKSYLLQMLTNRQ